MIILADESVDKQIVERLRRDGHAVGYVAELDPGIDDDLVLSRSNHSGAILLTADKDFGELVFRLHRQHGGVALYRLAGLAADEKAAIVSNVISQYGPDLASQFAVISRKSVRIRRA